MGTGSRCSKKPNHICCSKNCSLFICEVQVQRTKMVDKNFDTSLSWIDIPFYSTAEDIYIMSYFSLITIVNTPIDVLLSIHHLTAMNGLDLVVNCWPFYPDILIYCGNTLDSYCYMCILWQAFVVWRNG
jgi:hypothetical protein